LQQSPDVGEKTHVQHPICLVEHEVLDLVELRVWMPQMVQ